MSSPLKGTHYEEIRELGVGAYGRVLLARDTRTGKEVAVKLIRRNPNDETYMQLLEREVLLHRSLKHPHIVGLKEVFTAGTNHLAISMECCSGGSLFDYVRKWGNPAKSGANGPGLQEGVARWFLQQLVLTLDYCHAKGVAHRDIKLENILLTNVPGIELPLARMADFGLSRQYDSRNPCMSSVGTLAYMAPEILSQGNANSNAGYDGAKADVWSLGVALYAMLFNSYPFGVPMGGGGPDAAKASEQANIIRRILKGEYVIPEPPLAAGVPVSRECLDLLSRLLQRDTNKRANLQEIMSHDWIAYNLPPGASTMNAKLIEEEKAKEAAGESDLGRQPLEDVMKAIYGYPKQATQQPKLLF